MLNKCILGPVVVHPVPSPVIKNIEFSSDSKITPSLDPVLANCNWWFLVLTHQDGYLPNTSFYICYLVSFLHIIFNAAKVAIIHSKMQKIDNHPSLRKISQIGLYKLGYKTHNFSHLSIFVVTY
jgi:hypothetical protein